MHTNKEDREELAKRQVRLEARTTEVHDVLKEEIEVNFTRLWQFTEDVEK